MRVKLAVLAITIALLMLLPSGAKADTVTFDNVPAPCCYADTTYAPFVTPSITFTNGVVMNNSGWNNLATTAPNLYGTSDFDALSDGSFLPGFIVGTFTSGLGSDLSLDIINGFSNATFTLTAYDALNNVLGSDTISLACFGCGPGAVGNASVLTGGIAYFTITSTQVTNNVDFAIDTVDFNTSAVTTPEPSSLALLGIGLFGLLAMTSFGTRLRRFAGIC